MIYLVERITPSLILELSQFKDSIHIISIGIPIMKVKHFIFEMGVLVPENTVFIFQPGPKYKCIFCWDIVYPTLLRTRHYKEGAFVSINQQIHQLVNTLRPRQNGRHFADDTFKHISLNETVRILIQISPNCVLFLWVQLTIFQHWFR